MAQRKAKARSKKPIVTGEPPPGTLASILSRSIGETVTEEMILTDIEAGAPVYVDGQFDVIRYAAWLAINNE